MPTIKTNEIFANRYKLINQLGIGGYSEVWLAEDQYAGNMEVAVKIYAPGKGLDEDGLKTFGKEYTTVFNLNNAHLLKPMHYDVCEGSPYLVLQYCKNGSLYKKIGKFTEADVAGFLHESCEAIAYLHKKEPPIIHQDIKPDNFLIDEDGNYLLADFGISSKIRRTLTRSIGEKASTGTMAYMPPEKFNEDRQAIKAGDVFSLGVCVFELLTGELAFGDLGGLALKSGADLPKLPESFSKELNSIIRSCLAKDPWDRPTAESLVEIATNYKLNGKWDITKLPIVKQEVAEEPIIIRKEAEKQETRETVQIPLNEKENKKELPIAKPTSDSYGKYILIFGIAIALIFTIIYFSKNRGTSAEERAVAEQMIQDSIAQVEQQRINDSIAAAEQAYNDSITEVQALSNNYSSFDSKTKNKALKIGDTYAGGIIFYLDETGQHGLVCTPYDLSSSAKWDEAKELCINMDLNGYYDWYLPTKNDLELMYNKLPIKQIEKFSSYYWSSSEGFNNLAWYFYFDYGVTYLNNKNNTSYVRAVRAF